MLPGARRSRSIERQDGDTHRKSTWRASRSTVSVVTLLSMKALVQTGVCQLHREQHLLPPRQISRPHLCNVQTQEVYLVHRASRPLRRKRLQIQPRQVQALELADSGQNCARCQLLLTAKTLLEVESSKIRKWTSRRLRRIQSCLTNYTRNGFVVRTTLRKSLVRHPVLFQFPAQQMLKRPRLPREAKERIPSPDRPNPGHNYLHHPHSMHIQPLHHKSRHHQARRVAAALFPSSPNYSPKRHDLPNLTSDLLRPTLPTLNALPAKSLSSPSPPP